MCILLRLLFQLFRSKNNRTKEEILKRLREALFRVILSSVFFKGNFFFFFLFFHISLFLPVFSFDLFLREFDLFCMTLGTVERFPIFFFLFMAVWIGLDLIFLFIFSSFICQYYFKFLCKMVKSLKRIEKERERERDKRAKKSYKFLNLMLNNL